jgi:alkanesulfonate monooxygenase SsuD/methylene tetrahydromethanopterin reductase-like flavin-dependent oxidoreductase (luciferase family)
MRAYLEAMSKAPYQSVQPPEKPQTVLAALGPNMLKLAAEQISGAHPYFVPVEHTRRLRRTQAAAGRSGVTSLLVPNLYADNAFRVLSLNTRADEGRIA